MNMTDSQVIERIANNVGCSVPELEQAHREVYENHSPTLLSAGKTEEEAEQVCLMMAAQQVRKRAAALQRSGCEAFEGVFISVPRSKDFAALAYNKMENTLNNANNEVRTAIVGEGEVMLFTPNGDGGFTRRCNTSLSNRQPLERGAVTEATVQGLPKHYRQLIDGSYFCVVWDNKSPTFPSTGNTNYRYGKARPNKEPERTSLFYGSKAGTNDALSVFAVKASGGLSRRAWPTFIGGKITARLARRGDILYLKEGVSAWVEDEDVATMFDGPPNTWNYEQGIDLTDLSGLDGITNFVDGLDDKRRWNALVSLNLEVIQIDPLDRGGFVITLGDTDYSSLSMPIDLFVPASQTDSIDFGVGSLLYVVGQAWVGDTGEGRLSPTGWSVTNAVTLSAEVSEDDDDGWE